MMGLKVLSAENGVHIGPADRDLLRELYRRPRVGDRAGRRSQLLLQPHWVGW